MAKKKAGITPEIMSEKKLPKSIRKSDIIDVEMNVIHPELDEDSLIDQLALSTAALPKISTNLPAMRKSTDLKVQDPLTLYLKEISQKLDIKLEIVYSEFAKTRLAKRENDTFKNTKTPTSSQDTLV